MKAEELISLAGARSVDLVSAAQSRSDVVPRKDTETYVRCGLRVVKLLEGPTSAAYGKQTPTIVPPEWSSEDAALALAGLDRACGSIYPALAALYAWAGHDQNYHRLLDGLMRAALQMRRDYNWPVRVRGVAGEISYLDNLARMVLDDDRCPGVLDYAPEPRPGQADRKGELRAQYCDVPLAVWRSQLADRYALLRGVWIEWLDTAARWAQRRLREEEV